MLSAILLLKFKVTGECVELEMLYLPLATSYHVLAMGDLEVPCDQLRNSVKVA
jgi:hypothetical protein